ncbi:MAG: 3-deoxy-D-manno-octulosonic acid transferase [Neisseriaceae bacterium]|nr:3-deoxy-D-manno-octulosonic acid transferase [Neisseriaceae bacterium]
MLWSISPNIIRIYLRYRARKNPAYLEYWQERFDGTMPDAKKQVIWLHAVSVGEINAAVPIIKIIQHSLPEKEWLITCMTPTGRARIKELFPSTQCRYLPYDKPSYVKQFLQEHQPIIAIFMETEIWVNYILECSNQNIPTALINARLSEKSLSSYLKFYKLFRPTFASLQIVLSQSQADKERLHRIGAQSVKICGNSKYDILPTKESYILAEQFKQKIGNRQVIICASTREKNGIDEALLLLEAWKKIDYPKQTLLVIIPRHPERFQTNFDIAQKLGFKVQKRSDNCNISPDTEIWIGDSMGELFAYYLCADIAFVGGSLVDTGCQNIIEPISCNIPTIFGYSTFNFAQATKEALESKVALQVLTPEEWATTCCDLLKNQTLQQEMKNNSHHFISKHQGASQKMADKLIKLISN